ncbi:MAG: M20/M25/M40 family metallo-hydrolase [Bacteriovoracaceae bacterium]
MYYRTVFFLFFISINLLAQTPSERLETLVSINSGSENIAGVNKVQETFKPWLEELGFKVELIANPNGAEKSGKILSATLQGESEKYITFSMHADTVFEPSSPFQKINKVDNNKWNGPGVIDDKGGLVVMYLALKDYLVKNKKPKYSLRVLVTPNEEVGAIGFWEMFEEFSKDSWMVLGLEPSHENGIVHSRKGNRWIEITVVGKEAHAGRHHQDGINACRILAEKLVEISKLTDYKKEVTVSVGHMEGGQDKFNIVCGTAKAKVDTRSPSWEKRNELVAKIDKILKDPRISYIIDDETKPFSMNKLSKKYVEQYLETIKKVEGVKPLAHASGGTGDCNHFSREGIVIIDGLGPIGGEVHTEREWIDLKSIESRAKVLSQFLKEI